MPRPKRFLALWTAPIGVFFLVVSFLPSLKLGLAWLPFLGAATFGALGLLQGFALNTLVQVRATHFAILSAAAGFAVMTGVVLLVPRADPDHSAQWLGIVSAIGAGTGLALGGLQLVCLRKWVRTYFLWPAITALAWVVGYAIEAAFWMPLTMHMSDSEFYRLLAAGGTLATMTIGGISGVGMLLLIGERR